MENIGIVSLNLNVERVYAVPRFAPGGVYRPRGVLVHAGGKGINAANVLRTLGYAAPVAGCLGGQRGSWAHTDLERRKIDIVPFITIAETRICLIVHDNLRHTSTVINEPGIPLARSERKQLLSHVAGFAAGKDVVLFSGSVVPGVSPAEYARMAGGAVKGGSAVIVDIGGEHLLAAMRQKPYIVKPNFEEWQGALGRTLRTEIEVRRSAREALAQGVSWLVLSRGDKGLLAYSRDGEFEVRVPRVRGDNTVGCGDALSAGLAAGCLQKKSPEEMLRFAAATAAAHVLGSAPGHVRKVDVKRLVGQVRVTRRGLK